VPGWGGSEFLSSIKLKTGAEGGIIYGKIPIYAQIP